MHTAHISPACCRSERRWKAAGRAIHRHAWSWWACLHVLRYGLSLTRLYEFLPAVKVVAQLLNASISVRQDKREHDHFFILSSHTIMFTSLARPIREPGGVSFSKKNMSKIHSGNEKSVIWRAIVKMKPKFSKSSIFVELFNTIPIAKEKEWKTWKPNFQVLIEADFQFSSFSNVLYWNSFLHKTLWKREMMLLSLFFVAPRSVCCPGNVLPYLAISIVNTSVTESWMIYWRGSNWLDVKCEVLRRKE